MSLRALGRTCVALFVLSTAFPVPRGYLPRAAHRWLGIVDVAVAESLLFGVSTNPFRQANDMKERADPETFRARELSASLTVRDVEKSLVWYSEVAGFFVDQRYEREGKLRAVVLKAGSVRILLNQDDGAKGMDRVKGQGFSLQFTTAQSVDDVAKRITQRGGTLEKEPTDMPWGARIFSLRDPDGYKFVISSERKPA